MSSAFIQAAVILLREGLEAMLVIAALAGYLTKAGAGHRIRALYGGALAAVGASIVAAWLFAVLNSGEHSDILEGIIILVAASLMFYVSGWLMVKQDPRGWQDYLARKADNALAQDTVWAVAALAFLAVFREGAETALFYQALFTRGGDIVMPVSMGLLAGSATLAVIFTLFWRFGLRIPLRPFFAVTSALLYYMALVFAGSGIKELQEANVLPRTMIPGFPHVDLIGLYPTVETLIAQGVLIVLLLFALWSHFKPSAADEAEETAEPVPPEVAARLAELQATARRLQDRVSTLEKEIESETKPR
jgi:high-affinity iron transporter